MPTSVRLDKETEARLRRLARATGRSKSWVVREAVASYEPAGQSRPPFEALAPFIGAGDTGRTDLSDDTGAAFTALVTAAAKARRAG